MILSYPRLAFLKCARHPELLEYPHAILQAKHWNPPDKDLDEDGQGGVPNIALKYGMGVL